MTDEVGPKAGSQALNPWHKRLIWAGVAVVGMCVTYVVGRIQTSGKIDAAEAQTASFQEASKQHQREASAERVRGDRLEARRRMHLMLLALDQRNFGIAKEHQEVAARLLKKHTGEDSEAFSKLGAKLEEFPVRATEDLAAQRSSILKLAQHFDQLLPAKQ